MKNFLCSTVFQTPTIRLPFSQGKAIKNRLILTICLVFSVFCAQAQWKKLTTPTIPPTTHVLSIHFVNDNIGYVVGTQGLIRKTIDAGATWTNQINNIPSGAYIASTYFIDALTGFVVGDNDLIRRTDDGGVTWITITPTSSTGQAITGQAYRAVWFYNAYEGYITGGVSAQSGIILRTMDGGKTWSDVSPNPNNGNAIYGIFKKDALIGYAVDFDGRIIKSSNGGISWDRPVGNTPLFPNTQLGSIYFLTDQVGFICGGNAANNTGIIYKTTNGGGNWNILPFTTNRFLSDIKFFGNTGYAVGGVVPGNNLGVIYKNTDGLNSNTWTAETLTLNTGRQSEVSISSTNIAYTCGLNGTVYKLSPKPCCDDFMTSAINAGIQISLVSGNIYNFCLPSAVSGDIISWDLDCNNSPNTPLAGSVPPCANFALTSANTTICATITRINGTDTCRVKVNACLPKIIPCVCDSTFFNAVSDCFTIFKNTSPSFTYTFTPKSLQNNCDSVLWTFQDNTQAVSAGNQSVTHTFPSAGNRQICMIVTRRDANGNICKRECCLPIVVTTAIAEIPEVSLLVKPNPTYNAVSISIPANLVKKENILRLSTIEGRVLMTVSADATETNMNLHNLPAGLYFLSLTDSKGNILARPTKLVKQ